MPTPRTKGWFGVAMIFVWGLLLGASISLYITQNRLQTMIEKGKLREKSWLLATLEEKLSLNDAQSRNISEFFDHTSVERSLARIRTRPIINEPAYRLMAKVRSVLENNQQDKLTQVLKDSVNANRAPMMSALLWSLDLRLLQRQQFDRILAKHAADETIIQPTVKETLLTLLIKATPEIQEVLTKPQLKIYQDFITKESANKGSNPHQLPVSDTGK